MQILAKVEENLSKYSLRENVFYRFQEIFLEIKQQYPNIGSFILIVDAESLRIISATLKMADLLKMGVSSIEKLELCRKQHPKLHAVYILSPSLESVDLLIKDFTEKVEERIEKQKKDKKKKKKKKGDDDDDDEEDENEIIEDDDEMKNLKKNQHSEKKKKDKEGQQNQLEENIQYARVHLFFRSKLPKSFLEKIAGTEKLVKRIRTIKELNHDYLLYESNGFHFDLPNSLPILFSRKESSESDILINCIGEKLLSVFPSFLRFEKVSILFSLQDPLNICTKVANYLQKNLQEQELRLKQGESSYVDSTAGEIFLLLIDRSIDPVTPLIHDYSYQSMIYDLLEVNTHKNIVEYEKVETSEDKQKKEVKTYKQQLSDDKDEVFSKFRYKSITQSLNGIREDFQRHTESMQKASNKDTQPKSIEDVQKIINEFPQYKEMLSKYALHFDLILRCYNQFVKWNLQFFCELEQAIITGITDVGKKIQSEKIFPQLLEAINQQNIKQSDRIRLALTSFVALDLSKDQRDVIQQSFDLSEQKILKNLSWLGITFSDDKKQTQFCKVNEKLTELSIQKYNAYLEKNKTCFACKQLRGDSKSNKKQKGEPSQKDCDQCGQLYFEFSVMRHTPLSTLVIHSTLKQIESYSYSSQNPFESMGLNRKVIGGQSSQLKKQQDVVEETTQQQDSKEQNENRKKEKKIKKGESQKQKEGIIEPKNELQNLLAESKNEQDDEEQKKMKKLIVFFIGGISYAEIRAIRQLQDEKFQSIPIIIGGTHLLTPSAYLSGLEQMTQFG